MKVLIVDSYYPRFLSSVLNSEMLEVDNYEQLLQRILDLRFGTADFYSRNLNALGHDARDIIFNCEPLQRLWALENDFAKRRPILRIPQKLAQFPYIRRFGKDTETLRAIALRQIRDFRPDVLYLQDLNLFPRDVLQQLRDEGAIRLAVGQIACPLPEWQFLDGLDLILTSFPHYVPRFRARGIAAEYFRIGFDPTVLDLLGSPTRDLACTFVGGISQAHSGRLNLLEQLARNVDVVFFGYGADSIERCSPIRPRHKGDAWALDMYRALARSRITLNVHIDTAENNANNMRLYEATGCGALLITDMKDNLGELFEVGREVVAYEDVDDAIDKIRHYIAHPEDAAVIARAGQARTLRDHTYTERMTELAYLLDQYLRRM